MRYRRLPSGLVVPWRDPEVGRMAETAEALQAIMGWDLGAGGSGLPAGGAVNQTVLNTAAGTGTWQDVAAALVAGSGITLTTAAHITTIATVGPLGVAHYAEYTFSFSQTANTQVAPTGAVWTLVKDTDNFGSTLAASGTYTIPAGLAGFYVVFAYVNFPGLGAGNYTQNATILLHGATTVGRTGPGPATAITQDFSTGWAGSAAAADTFSIQDYMNNSAASAQILTGRFTIGLVAPVASSGLTPTAVKTAAYTAVAGDLVLCNTTGGGFAITTPAAPVNGQIFAVKWYQGGTAPTITGNVDGNAGGATLAALGAVLTLQYNAALTTWLIY